MPCRCGNISCLCKIPHLNSESTCKWGDREMVPGKTCNKPFCQEKTIAEESRELCICPVKNTKNKVNSGREIDIENIEVDSIGRENMQKTELSQEIQNKTDEAEVVQSVSVAKCKSSQIPQLDEYNGTNQVTEQAVGGEEAVNKSFDEDDNKYRVAESITNRVSERMIASVEVDITEAMNKSKWTTPAEKAKTNLEIQGSFTAKVADNPAAELESKYPTPIEEKTTNQVIRAKTVEAQVNIPEPEEESKCGTEVVERSGTHQEIQSKTSNSTVSYNSQEADEEMKTVNKETWLKILKLKRMKDKIEKIHHAIDKFEEDKQKVTNKVSTLLSSKENDAADIKKIFDTSQKYYNRIANMIYSVSTLTNKIEKMTNKVETVTNELRELASNLPEITVQFQNVSLDSQNASIEVEVNPKTSSDERSLIRKMLKISDKMQKNLIYCNDSLLKSK